MTDGAMKVLHLPINIASQVGITVRALRDRGVDARGIVFNNHSYQDGEGLETYPLESLTNYPVRGRLQRVSLWRAVLKGIAWADVVHWHFRNNAIPFDLDLRYAARLKKPRLVEFWGSDIRVPEIASADNPYIEEMYALDPEAAHKESAKSRRTQERFARHGFECLIPSPEMVPFVFRDLFPKVYSSVARLDVSELEPVYPDPKNARPVIVHHPSNKLNKGTQTVLDAVEALKGELDFEFRLLHQMARDEVLSTVQSADIALGEFVSGDYGLAVLEAMALGKPTVCYIKPAVVAQLPSELPVVNANQDNLTEVLRELLTDGEKRHSIGRRSRDYVLNYHDASKSAENLVGIYEELLQKDSTHA